MQGAAGDGEWWVVSLCAAWCGVCREWQPLFDAQARAHPHLRFAWVDIEDESDALGEVDVETFPTVLVAKGDDVLFLGPIPPSAPQFARLLARLQAQPEPAPGLAAHARGLFERLRKQVLARPRV
jgi:thioredoxin 1